MTPFFDDLERQLHSAARARPDVAADAPPAAPRRRRRWGWLGAVPALAAVAVTRVIAGAALLLFGHRTPRAPVQPSSGLSSTLVHTPAPQLRRELAYIRRATRRVLQSRACQTTAPAGPTFIHGSPDRTLLSTVGVLRRPAEPSDRLAAQWLGGDGQVYAGFIRRSLIARGVSYYVIAARNIFSASVPSDRCFALQTQALHTYAGKIPAALRAATLTLQAQFMSYDRRLISRAPGTPSA